LSARQGGARLNVFGSIVYFCPALLRSNLVWRVFFYRGDYWRLAFSSVVLFRKMRVCELKKVVFSNLSLEEKVKLKDSGRPTPILNIAQEQKVWFYAKV
jgi:hypothetical protein